MAYDFGSQTLGIKNPFKFEGAVRAAAGVVAALIGVYPLVRVAPTLQNNPVMGWTLAIVGFLLLAGGLRHAGQGMFQLFRYFVGRSVPTSLAYNQASSEQETADLEKKSNSLLYDVDSLHAMLMGRKNSTFLEPIGWMARLVHSIFPRLTFLPYPLRHYAQEISGMAINSMTALVAFAIAWFVVSTGLAGKAAPVVIMPLLSIVLLTYLIVVWFGTASSTSSITTSQLQRSGGLSFGGLIALAIAIPVLSGFYLDKALPYTTEQITAFEAQMPLFSAWLNLAVLLLAIVVSILLVAPLLRERMKEAMPQTEVSEYRENMQESVHPEEIFINIENIVLANRRYKEMPNRIYNAYEPSLKEQSQGKGSFSGSLIIETQPEVSGLEYSSKFKLFRKLLTLSGQLFFVAGIVVFYLLAVDIAEIVTMIEHLAKPVSLTTIAPILSQFDTLLTLFFVWLTFYLTSRVLNTGSHLFWGEMQFQSLLMFLKTEGTYTESKISTGMAIHDSTRSENVVVRSSITPWIISCRITTSIFATSGSNNLEAPRFIINMAKNDDELNTMVTEIKTFLRDREAIASITNERDLDNAGRIYQVNEQMRSLPGRDSNQQRLTQDEEAAGYLRNEQEDDRPIGNP